MTSIGRREAAAAPPPSGLATLRPATPGLAALGLLGLLLGCPTEESPPTEDDAASPSIPAPPSPEAFRRQAHQEALAALRRDAPDVLRVLDPVAAAEVEGTALHPPGFGAVARAARRKASSRVQRDAGGISAALLSPPDAVVLRALQAALEREEEHLQRPPWRDDPRALVYAVEPYLHALRRRIDAGQCDDGCGLAELGPALRLGLAELGAASEPTLTAAREDLAALRRALPQWTEGLPPAHPLVIARGPLDTELEHIDAELQQAAAALPTAAELPWATAVAPAAIGGWKRRPTRWGSGRLQRFLEDEEAHGLQPDVLLQRVEATVMRLGAMTERDERKVTDEPPLPRPFDAAACETAWAPLQAWVQAQGSALVTEPPCASVLRTLPAEPSDADIVLRLIDHGVVEPTRRVQVAATGIDVALVRGRAAPTAQRLVLQIAITAGTDRRTAELVALGRARERACTAAAALWIHGELGDAEALAARLGPHGCGEVAALVAAAEARPRAALEGLGLVLVGDGPADAAALDRYWWAPMGLVRDLALPPALPTEVQPPVHIEPLAPEGGSG